MQLQGLCSNSRFHVQILAILKKGGYTLEKYSPLLYHIRKLMTDKRVLRPMKPESCVLARIWLW